MRLIKYPAIYAIYIDLTNATSYDMFLHKKAFTNGLGMLFDTVTSALAAVGSAAGGLF